MTSAKATVATLLCCVSALVTGCSTSSLIGPVDNSPVTGAAIQGIVHGGQNPVIGATVQLWAVGTGGYGSAATKLGSSVQTVGPSGTFTLGSYACVPGTQTYITSQGGNPGLGAGTNSNIMMVAALGNCSNLSSSTTIFINEVSTVAAAYALGQYFTPAVGGLSSADSFGAPNTLQATTGITNAMSTVNNLVCAVSPTSLCSTATGNAVQTANFPGASGSITAWSIATNVATFTAPNSLVAGDLVALSGFGTSTFFNGVTVTVLAAGLSSTQFEANLTHANGSAIEAGAFGAGSITMTPESGKLYTIADILAACVNSAGGTVGDGSACGTLFADVVPTSGTAPTDTLQAAVYMSLNPTSTNANTSATNLSNLCGLVPGVAPYNQQGAPYSTACPGTTPSDWTLGIQYAGTSSTMLLSEALDLAADASGNIWVINNPGSASDSLTELSPTGSPLFTSTLASGSATLASENPRNLAIDTAGNIWVATSSGSAYLLEYNPTTTGINTLNLGSSTYGLAIDGSNNVWVGKQASGTSFTFNEFLGGTLATTNEVEYPVISPLLQPEYVAVDTSGNVWATEGSTSTAASTMLELSNINTSSCGTLPFAAPCTVTSSNSINTYTTVSAGPLLEPFGLAASSSGIWVANAGSSQNTVVDLTGSGSSITGTAFGSAASVNSPHYLAVDGAGNIWVANKDASSSIGGTVSELSSTGAILSATAGEVGYAHLGLSAGEGIAVDPSGNVWIADNTTSGTAAYSVFELVGAAAPTVTPISLALKNSAVAKKP